MDKIEQLKSIITKAKKITFFTGAGVSVASGIPDFRSKDGLYNMTYAYPPEEIVSHTFLTQNTKVFYDFYFDKMVYPHAKPSKIHQWIAGLEKRGKDVCVVTQNIDGLHQAAGSRHVIELHGSVHRNYCVDCHKQYESIASLRDKDGIPRCTCGGMLRPDVVLYEESLDETTIYNAIKAIDNTDTLVVMGTSLAVYPAAGFLHYFKGNNFVFINKDPTPLDYLATLAIYTDFNELDL